MSRDIGAANLAHIAQDTVWPIALVKFGFGTPVYVHSGLGNITYDGNTYVGVGDLGGVDGVEESEDISPTEILFTMSAIPSTYINEALDAGSYGDEITMYQGYRGTDGALVGDPWIVARGYFEHATIELGSVNKVTIAAQHELAILDERPGRRWTDEDQQAEYAGDTGFSFAADMPNNKLLWGGEVSTVGGGGGGNGPRDVPNPGIHLR